MIYVTCIVSLTSFLVPPDPPVVELKEVKDNMFSLAWTPGFEGDSPIAGFILEYKALNGKTFISAFTC